MSKIENRWEYPAYPFSLKVLLPGTDEIWCSNLNMPHRHTTALKIT